MAELIALNDLSAWNKISTAVFFLIFVAYTLWVYRPGARGVYEAQGALPLDEEDGERHGR